MGILAMSENDRQEIWGWGSVMTYIVPVSLPGLFLKQAPSSLFQVYKRFKLYS